ncbi:unnamed protein product, partial [Polarella glacialis]
AFLDSGVPADDRGGDIPAEAPRQEVLPVATEDVELERPLQTESDLWLAVFHGLSGNHMEAEDMLWKLAREHPQDALIQMMYGLELMGLKLYTEAEHHLREAMGLDPTDWRPAYHLGTVLHQTEIKPMEARELLRRAAVRAPREPDVWKWLAFALAQNLDELREEATTTTTTADLVEEARVAAQTALALTHDPELEIVVDLWARRMPPEP